MNKNGPMKPTKEDADYVFTTTDGAKCPFCGNSQWLAHALEGDEVSQVMITYINPSKSYMLPTIPLSCDSCGFMRLHDLSIVRGKVKGWR